MKILIVFNHPAPYKVRLFNELAKEVDLDVLFERRKAKDRPDSFYNENRYDFNAMFIKHGAIFNEGCWSGEVKSYIKKHHKEYDLIIMNGYSHLAEIKAIKYLKRKHIPYCLYVNGGVIKNDSKLKKKIKKTLISPANFYISPSKEATEYLKHYGAVGDFYEYNYASIREADILTKPLSKEEKKKIREKYNLPDGPLFVNASQFIDRKNNLELLSLFKDRKEKLLLVGSGPELENYQKYIAENDLQNVIIKDFMRKDELFDLLGGCDYFITLSKEDIYGHTINEAFARGLPVISSENVVAAHRLINDKNGIIVSLLNKKSIINSINDIESKNSLDALMTAHENTLEVMVKQHIDIFKRIIERK